MLQIVTITVSIYPNIATGFTPCRSRFEKADAPLLGRGSDLRSLLTVSGRLAVRDDGLPQSI